MENRDISKLKIDKSSKTGTYKKGGKNIYWLAAGVVLLMLAFLGFKGVFSSPMEVKTATVSLTYPSQSMSLLNASGYVVAQRKASVASKTTGRLVWLGVEEGSRVKTGQVIARLENDDVTAAREQAAANLKVAFRNLDQAKAELDDSQLSFNRNRELLTKGFVSRSEYDASEARYKKAHAAVEAAEATIKANQAALKGADVSLGYTLIRSPFDAVVLTKNADIGDIITPLGAAANAKAAVVTIADMGSLQVEVDVSESNIEKVKIGQPCEIQLDALPDIRLSGAVHMIVPTADRTKASVMVKVRFIDKDPRILPEMSAKVAFLNRTLKADEKKPRTTVDPSAVVSRNGKKTVFTIKGDRVAEAAVELGEKVGDAFEVLSGVRAGDRVVINPPASLKTGAGIKVIEK